VAVCALDGLADHRHHVGVALVEIKGDDLGVAVHAQHQLRQVVGADGETVEMMQERFGQQRVGRNLAHHDQAQSFVAALQSVLRQ